MNISNCWLLRALHEIVSQVKMIKIHLNCVEKTANSGLLAAFPALFSQIFPHFSSATYSCLYLLGAKLSYFRKNALGSAENYPRRAASFYNRRISIFADGVAILRIIDRMLLRELTLTFLAVISVLLLITYGGEATKLLGRALDGRVPVNLVGQLLLLKLPDVLGMIIPLSVLIAVVLTFGRLYQDQEMVVLSSSGVSPNYFRKLLMWFLLPITLLLYLLLNVLDPMALQYEKKLLVENQSISPIAALQEGKFNPLPKDKGVLYAKTINADGTLEQVWIKYRDGSNDLILMAPSGKFVREKNGLVLRLQDGWRYQNLHGSLQTQSQMQSPPADGLEVQSFELFEGVIPELSIEQSKLREREMFTWQLLDSDSAKTQALIQWRLNMPLGVLVLGLIGLMLSKSGPRQGRFGKMFLAIVVFILFNQALSAGESAIEKGHWLAEIGLWPIPLLFLLVGLGLFAWLQATLRRWLISTKIKPQRIDSSGAKS
ncbi:lipopolysaccharide export system permease protein [uncultured Thiomicrorhabdus sp.]